MGLKWLITGGCGFIGRNLIKNLTDDGGHYIRVLDNLSVGSREDLAKVSSFEEIPPRRLPETEERDHVHLVIGDILDAGLAIKTAAGMDIIVHLAANTGVQPSVENPWKDCEINVIGTFNCLEAARYGNVRRFIFASSGAPAGECEPPIHEELAPHPTSPYGASKLAGEGYCSAYYRSFGIETVVLRFGNAYGPFSSHKDSVVAKFIRQGLRGDPLEIYGTGEQTRDFIFIEDLISAIRLASVTRGVEGEIFQIATNNETTINQIIALITGIFSEKRNKPIETVNSHARIGDVKRNFSDTSKALDMMGWKSTTDLSTGIESTFEWFLKNENSNIPSNFF